MVDTSLESHQKTHWISVMLGGSDQSKTGSE